MVKEEKKELVWKFLLTSFSIFITLMVGFMTWLVVEVHRLDVIINSIQSSRCTNLECNSLRRDIDRNVSRVDRIPTEIPPPWIREKVAENSERLSVIESVVEIGRANKRMEAQRK